MKVINIQEIQQIVPKIPNAPNELAFKVEQLL